MSFVLDMPDKYRYTVAVPYYDEDGARKEKSFKAIFRRLKTAELKSLVDATTSDDPDKRIDDAEFIRRVLVGWSGITNGAGEELEFSEVHLDAVLDTHPLPTCIVQAWFESIRVGERKN